MIQEVFRLQNPWRYSSSYSFKLKNRQIFDTIYQNMDNELILGLIGSRQVGKSSLIYMLINQLLTNNVAAERIFYFNLDDLLLHSLFNSTVDFLQFINNSEERTFVFIDEIQRLESPGLFLKSIFDLRQNLKIVYSGSSQLEIKAKTKEHLVGRVRIFEIHRLSLSEYQSFASPITRAEALNQMLVYGSYPAVAKEISTLDKKLRLRDIYQSYVQKDLIDFLHIENSSVFNKLLVLLANQIGDLLNVHTLAQVLPVSRTTVEQYLNILEQTFICKRIYPFYQNYGKEITKTPKMYFLDLGLRNFILNSFDWPDNRQDTGALFENFILTELLIADQFALNKVHYWRTTNQTEIDFVVRGENRFDAIEVKWNKKKTTKAMNSFKTHYPDSRIMIINKELILENKKLLY